MPEIAVTINGKEFVGRTGQTILELATDNGIDIPNLCHDPRLVPAGSCRLCLVEVVGQKSPVTACTFKVEPGMVVQTETDEIRAIRKTILELLFYEHRGVCTTCNENGDCALQQYAYQYKIPDEVFTKAETSEPKTNYTTGNEAIEYELDKCIRCGRCIRICQEVQMDSALTFKERAVSESLSLAVAAPRLMLPAQPSASVLMKSQSCTEGPDKKCPPMRRKLKGRSKRALSL